MQNNFRIALLQMNILPEAVEHNLRTALALAQRAVQEGAKVLVLPEMWSTDFLSLRNKDLAGTTAEVLKKLSGFAKEHKVYILGSLPELKQQRLYNTFYVVNAQGKVAGAYRKAHLFKLTGEHLAYTAGQKTLALNTPYGRWSLAICFDIRFPEFIAQAVRSGVQVLLVCAQWPQSRKEHWETLLRARAIEHQIFVAGVNRVGKNKNLEYPGSSLVVDPWGDILAEGSSGEEIITCDIDLAKIKEAQKKLPMN